MAFFDNLFESIKAFEKKGESKITPKQLADRTGEGIDDIFSLTQGYGVTGVGSFNKFYNRYINKLYESEYSKIIAYRRMAESPEIADVIEDIINESTQEDDEGRTIQLILNDRLTKNKNVYNNLYREFYKLFYDNIDINHVIDEWLRSFYVDGRLYLERIIKKSNPSAGIINVKKLPAETMDYEYDPITGQKLRFYQYLGQSTVKPVDEAEARKRNDIVLFLPEQIGYSDYGLYGRTKYEIYGYLEKAKVPYNQLKLLETSIIIYRIIRAPERFVFKIDTGQMPKDKALKFVEKIKNSFIKKQSYDPTTGSLTQEPDVFSILENFFIPQSSDGRGSDITTIGGDPSGFKELDDLYYFARKLYRSLKYPMSRITAAEEHSERDSLFGGNGGDISRDEVKWAKFLERQQDRLCNDLQKMFMLHLEFIGLKQEYGIRRDDITLKMNPPSHYKEAMEQNFREMSFNNYNALANNEEFSKYFLMKKYLHLTDEEINDNSEGFKKDKELFSNGEEGEETSSSSEKLSFE